MSQIRLALALVSLGVLSAVLTGAVGVNDAAAGHMQAIVGPKQPAFYVHPVHGPVADPFRAPAQPWLSGNRGLEYANPLWVPVVASADGLVVFAGQVFGSGTVVIEHPDGVRTTYSGLSPVWVGDGIWVRQLDGLGLAGTNVHFGAKRANTYIDPQILIDASVASGSTRLVPVNPPP